MVNVVSLSKTPLEDESDIDFIRRMCSIKSDLKMTWKSLAEHINATLGLDYSESWYRKNYQNCQFEATVTTSTNDDCDVACETCEDLPNCLNEWAEELSVKEQTLNDLQHKLSMKKVEVSDLVVQNNAYVRRLSREQTIKDIAYEYAKVMNKEKVLTHRLSFCDDIDLSDTEGILLLSDWHYGMVCDNPWNKYDPEICKERVNKLLNKTIDIVKKNNIERVHVLDLADLIAGRIHTQIRIESRFDVITQTMQVAELLAEFLDSLSYHCYVSFYSCLDNHSRLEPNKKESLDLESLARLIPWYLSERLKDNDCIDICDNQFGEDIITCTIAGHSVIGVHGDNDKPTNALERLTLMTNCHYDLLCAAHLHHFSCEENHGCMVVGNASLMGVDAHSAKLRLSSKPSQTFIVSTSEDVCSSIHRIVLD